VRAVSSPSASARAWPSSRSWVSRAWRYSSVAGLATAGPHLLGAVKDASEEEVARLRGDEEGGKPQRGSEERLTALALNGWIVRDPGVIHQPSGDVPHGQRCDEMLQVHGPTEVLRELQEEAVMPALKAGEAERPVLAEPVGQIGRHPLIEHPEVREIPLQSLQIAHSPVQAGTLVRTEERDQVIDEAKIRHEIAAKPKDPRKGLIQESRAEGRDGAAEDAKAGLLLPPPPQHPEMRVIQLVRQKAQDALGMEVGEVEPVGRGAVGPNEERQKVLDDLDDEVAQRLLLGRAEARAGTGQDA